MKKAKQFFKYFAITTTALALCVILTCTGFFVISTKGVSLNRSILDESTTSSVLQIFDINGNQIKPTTENFISIKKLSSDTKNAFICAEDKRFYNHNGLDYIRIGGAIASNIKSRSFSEGASTISQQLIKNTHLSNEKTIKRKLKEFKLTKQLENIYSKEEILEMYLNNIYFGNGCYGIENASLHYFGKSASKLSLAESALLAATINAPSIYDIENNIEKALSRRNLILNLMEKHGKITNNEKLSAQSEELNLKLTKLSGNNFIYNEIIEEASLILGKTQTQIKNSNIKIYSHIDLSLQNKIQQIIKNNYSKLESSPNVSSIIINNKTNGITAIIGNKSSILSKKQPGSTIKPILVYAPAIELGKISPATKILDEKINISGYSPENADKKYHGYVSVRESLKNSYNIPAVKILQETGIEQSQNIANKFGIEFSESDNNLAIALGGFTDGTTLKQLADAYSALANNGLFSSSKYINKIETNSKVVYENKPSKTKAISSSTAYLLTNILQDTTKTGTAKRLKDFSFDIASKTGTVGSSNSNTDSYNISYTTNHTILSYIGGTSMPSNINGATYPTMLTKDVLSELYKTKKPQNFTLPDSVVIKHIDKTDYQNNIISQTDNIQNSITETFAKNNLPQKTKTSLNLKLDVFNFENKKPILCFHTSQNYTYNIIRKQNEKEEIISSLTNINDSKIAKFEDKTAENDKIYEYFVEICEKSSNKTFKTNSVKLKTYSIRT